MTDLQIIAIGLFLGVSASIPVALIIAISTRQPRDVVDFTGWFPPDEISEETAVTTYFDGIGNEVTP